MHTGTVCVEYAGYLNFHAVLAAVIKEQGFRASLAFIIAGSWAYTVNIAAVGFGLRMKCRISIYFRGRGLKDFCLDTLGQPEHINRSMDIYLCGLHRIILIMNMGGRAGQIVDFIYFNIQGEGDVVTKEFEIGVLK